MQSNLMKKITVVLCMVMLLAFLGQTALAATYSAKVLTSTMDVYLSPNAQSPAGSLAQGTSFNVYAINGEWAYISYRGHNGYAQMKSIMFDNVIAGYAVRDTDLLFITHESYSRGVSYRGRLAAGTRIYARGMSHGLLLVTNANGTILGFVAQRDCVRG